MEGRPSCRIARHFEADRAAAEEVLEVIPSMRLLARLARQQLIDAVGQLVGGFGIRQFLDVGTGLRPGQVLGYCGIGRKPPAGG